MKSFRVGIVTLGENFWSGVFLAAGLFGISSAFVVLPLPVSSADQYACVVGGHGPYNDALEPCQKIAQSQAKTNCALQSKTAEVKYSSSDLRSVKRPNQRSTQRMGKPHSGTCSSVYNSQTQDCAEATCR